MIKIKRRSLRIATAVSIFVVMGHSQAAIEPIEGTGSHSGGIDLFKLFTRSSNRNGAPAAMPSQAAVDAATANAEQLDDAVETDEEAADFLMQATFGPTTESIAELRALGYSEWFKRQLAYTPDLYLDEALDAEREFGSGRSAERNTMNTWFEKAATNDDQLRQVAVFALSQVMPTSLLADIRKSLIHATFKDALVSNAFGNYRDVLQDMTYTPLMGEWLTYAGNEKANPETGAAPDENFAREIMQLFTIGLVELQQNGRPKLVNGQEVETYDNTDITELAKVFTGLDWDLVGFQGRVGSFADFDRDVRPMVMYSDFHSEGPKTFLGETVPEYADGNRTISDALDILFNHENVAPFISSILIQRMVTSNPGAGYVERVSEAFSSGTYTLPDGSSVGTGDRGDLAATFAAILFDVGARGDWRFEDSDAGNVSGKVRDPITRTVHYLRVSDSYDFWTYRAYTYSDIGALPFRSPSVFNFYRHDYIPTSNLASGDADLIAPELQIYNGPRLVEYFNLMSSLVRHTDDSDSWIPRFTEELALADNPAALADHLNLVYTAGRMSDGVLQDMIDAIESISLERDNARLDRVRAATMLSISSIPFIVSQ
ncbi:DUF1800 domain-containing protein [Granulosicoccus sp.]|nr:DUF1800 domain-containing protein [Granulosicoccus sp.]